MIKSVEARLLLAKQDLEGKKAVGDGIAGRLIQKAQSEFDFLIKNAIFIAILNALNNKVLTIDQILDHYNSKDDAKQLKFTLYNLQFYILSTILSASAAGFHILLLFS